MERISEKGNAERIAAQMVQNIFLFLVTTQNVAKSREYPGPPRQWSIHLRLTIGTVQFGDSNYEYRKPPAECQCNNACPFIFFYF